MPHDNPMFHRKRRHNLAFFATPEEVADKLKRYSWTLCTGFRWSSLLLLNDSTSEDSIQEYSVIKLTPVDTIPLRGTMIESLTIDWIEQDDLVKMLKHYDADGSTLKLGEYIQRVHQEGPCHECA